MKKISIFTLVIVLTAFLTACGRSNNNPTSIPTASTPTTGVTILPDPTIGTNIPDPEVDTSMPMYTDGTGSTDATNNTANGTGMGMGNQP